MSGPILGAAIGSAVPAQQQTMPVLFSSVWSPYLQVKLFIPWQFTLGKFLAVWGTPSSENRTGVAYTAHLYVCGAGGLPGCPSTPVHTCLCQGLPVASRRGSGQARSSLYWGRPAWVKKFGDWIGNWSTQAWQGTGLGRDQHSSHPHSLDPVQTLLSERSWA